MRSASLDVGIGLGALVAAGIVVAPALGAPAAMARAASPARRSAAIARYRHLSRRPPPIRGLPRCSRAAGSIPSGFRFTPVRFASRRQPRCDRRGPRPLDRARLPLIARHRRRRHRRRSGSRRSPIISASRSAGSDSRCRAMSRRSISPGCRAAARRPMSASAIPAALQRPRQGRRRPAAGRTRPQLIEEAPSLFDRCRRLLSLTRNLDVTAGVRYKTERDRLPAARPTIAATARRSISAPLSASESRSVTAPSRRRSPPSRANPQPAQVA